MSGFKAFLLRGNLVDLAVGIVIGIAFGTLVTAFVKDLITPLIAALFGKPDFSALSFTINNSKFTYGDFINVVIAFLIIAVVMYFFVVVPYVRFRARFEPAPQPAPEMKDCPFCLSNIPAHATRCAFCTSDLTASNTPDRTASNTPSVARVS